jgi:hypothetical protein
MVPFPLPIRKSIYKMVIAETLSGVSLAQKLFYSARKWFTDAFEVENSLKEHSLTLGSITSTETVLQVIRVGQAD